MKKTYQLTLIFLLLSQMISAAGIKNNKIPNAKIKMLNGEYAKLSEESKTLDKQIRTNFKELGFEF